MLFGETRNISLSVNRERHLNVPANGLGVVAPTAPTVRFIQNDHLKRMIERRSIRSIIYGLGQNSIAADILFLLIDGYLMATKTRQKEPYK